MSVVRKKDLQNILFLQDRLNRLLEESLREWAGVHFPGEWVPHVDIFEDDIKIVLKAELSGVRREDIMVNISDGVLIISGKKRFEHAGHTESYHMMERPYGNFRRSFNIPNTVVAEKIDAKYERGVLEIVLKKHQLSTKRQIPISEG
ncbi:MAG: Hsp20/alpha crystallin family protein [Deltaproteobacteria bacterium]|nr:Hsp20/alpha crystallin family protein [Deltaproteobacteria bacterium]